MTRDSSVEEKKIVVINSNKQLVFDIDVQNNN